MSRSILLFVAAFALQATAGPLPDCSHRSLDPDRRIFIVDDASSPSMLALMQLLSTMEHKRYLFESLFPIIEDGHATIHTSFSRYYEAPSRKLIDDTLNTIASLDGVQVRCTRYQPGET